MRCYTTDSHFSGTTNAVSAIVGRNAEDVIQIKLSLAALNCAPSEHRGAIVCGSWARLPL